MIHSLTRTLALAVTTGAIAAPAASAMLPPPDSAGHSLATAPQPVIVKADASRGFDFGDAAIGAGAAAVALIVGAGGTIAVHRGRHPQTPPTATAG